MFYYHTFRDLEIPGIYDHTPLLPHYHFPSDNFWKGKSVLDVGCASGFFTKHFAERGAQTIAIDINVDVMRVVKERAKLSNLDIVEADLFDMEYDKQFDFVFCGSLLMHVFYPMTLLRLIHRSLRDGGLFVLCTGGIESPDPIMRVEKYMGREKGYMEKEVQSANESLWWLSPSAGISMLHTIGFKNIRHVDQFMLTSTPYGVEIGHNYSSLHHVWHANKSII